jgi:hypothetical protein
MALGFAGALLGGAFPVAAQGSYAVSLTTGRGDVQFGLSNPSTTTFGGGLTYTWGGGDKSSAFVGSGGLNLRYYNAETFLYGKVSSLEFSTPVAMGWRVGTVAFGGALEFRRIMRSEEDISVQQAGNGNVLLYGPYMRIALGRPGSVAGRFAVEGRYFWGEGWFEQFDGAAFIETGQVGQETTMDMADPRELRLALSFLATPRTILRFEFQDTNFPADLSSVYTNVAVPEGVGQRMKTLGLTVGLVF